MNGTIDFTATEEKQRAILMAFQNGQHMTVNDMQRIGHTTEGRKVVSRLRRQGHNIVGEKLNGDNFMTYWIPSAVHHAEDMARWDARWDELMQRRLNSLK